MLVRRPSDPAKANGIVAVEWLNVTGGQDADPDFGFIYPTLPIPGVNPTPLKTADPTRYAPLTHPGDDYSYDI